MRPESRFLGPLLVAAVIMLAFWVAQWIALALLATVAVVGLGSAWVHAASRSRSLEGRPVPGWLRGLEGLRRVLAGPEERTPRRVGETDPAGPIDPSSPESGPPDAGRTGQDLG